MKKKCRFSEKVKFDSFERAWIRAGTILEKYNKYKLNKKKFLRAYKCKDCGKIHLTSK